MRPLLPRSPVAQLAEHPAVNRRVVGSSPTRGAPTENMTIQRMDHVGIVVDDLPAATEFFVELGLVLNGEASLEGLW